MIEFGDIVPSIRCVVKMERVGNAFSISIINEAGEILQNFQSQNLFNGDTLHLNGLGFAVLFDGLSWVPPTNNCKKIDTPSIKLKRKMDIHND